ncbi:gametogenetin-binding protein 1-like [Mirounga angustirostris]|uniref:gametogenetin-binding protein 1-like n=1 Tax=Mirounga angustirostris TaxID=9716 RepID=UPI00313EAF54
MSSPMMASCRPTCPMVLEEQEPGRGHFAQALEVEQECPQRAMRPLEVSPKTFTREEEECLLDGDLRLASLKVGATPWNRLLTLYKQLQKSAMAKFPLKEGLPDEEKGKEEEMEEEDSSFKLCVPGIVTLQSPLHKTFRSTDNGGFRGVGVKEASGSTTGVPPLEDGQP